LPSASRPAQARFDAITGLVLFCVERIRQRRVNFVPSEMSRNSLSVLAADVTWLPIRCRSWAPILFVFTELCDCAKCRTVPKHNLRGGPRTYDSQHENCKNIFTKESPPLAELISNIIRLVPSDLQMIVRLPSFAISRGQSSLPIDSRTCDYREAKMGLWVESKLANWENSTEERVFHVFVSSGGRVCQIRRLKSG